MLCRLILNNFRGIENLSLELPINGIILLDGKSGAGKTTILEALTFVLYDILHPYPRDGKRKKTSVELNLPYISIYRQKRPNILKVKSENQEFLDQVAQIYINKKFGSVNNWLSSSYLKQNEICKFLGMTSSERLTFIKELILSDNYDLYFNRTNDKIMETEKQYNDIKYKLDLKYELYQNVDKLIPNEIKNKELWDISSLEGKNNQEKLDKFFEIQMEKYNKELSNLTTKLDNYKTKYDIYVKFKLEKEKIETQIKDFYDCSAEIKDLEDGRKQIENLYNSNINVKISDYHKYIESCDIQLMVEYYEFINTQIQLYNEPKFTVKQIFQIIKYKHILRERQKYGNLKYSYDQLYDMKEKRRLMTELQKFKLEKPKYDINLLIERQQYLNLPIVDKPKYTYEQLNFYIANKSLYDELKNLKYEECIYTLDQIRLMKKKMELNSIRDVNCQYTEEQLSYYKFIKDKYNIKYLKLLKDTLNYREVKEQRELINKLNLELQNLPIINPNGKKYECPKCNCQLYIENDKLIFADYYDKRIKIEEQLKNIKPINILYDKDFKDILQLSTDKIKDEIAKYENDIILCENLDLDSEFMKLRQQKRKMELISELQNIDVPDVDSTLDLDLEEQKILNNIRFNELKSKLKYGPIDEDINVLTENIIKYQEYKNKMQRLEYINKLLNIDHNEYIDIQREIEKLQEEEKRKEIQNRLIKYKDVHVPDNLDELITIYRLEYELYKFNTLTHISDEELDAELINFLNLDKRKTLCEIRTQLEGEIVKIIDNMLVQKRDQINLQLKNLYIINSQYHNLSAQLDAINSEMDKYKKYSDEKIYKMLINKRDKIKNDIKFYKDEIDVQKKLYNLYDCQNECIKYQEIHDNILNRLNALYKIKEALIKSEHLILENLLVEINNNLNEILTRLFNEPITVNISTMKQIKTTERIKPDINLEIFYKDCMFSNIDSLSGGEKSRLSLALMVVFSLIGKSPFLLLDESLSSLDSENKEKSIDVLRDYLDNKLIIAVNHDTSYGIYDSVVHI